jgi:phage terminase small subunit
MTKRPAKPRPKPAAPKLPATAPARSKWAEGLTDKEHLFVQEYLIDLNASQAAMRTGCYSTDGAARVAGHNFRRKPAVQEAISKAIAARGDATRSRIIEEISRLAFSNVADVMEIKDGHLVVRDHADLDRDTLSTVASIEEHINDKGYSTLRIKQHDRLAALTLLARISGMLINRQEISGPGGGPVEVEHTDYRERITRRLDEMAKRVAPPTELPIIDVTPQKVSPAALLAAGLREGGERE